MIVLIDNYDSFTYNLYQILAQQNIDILVVRNDKISIAQILELNVQGIVLSPGPGRPEDAGICVDLIKKSVNIPLLGVCLGMQALAYSFGARIIHAPVVMHGKQTLIFHKRQDLYQDMPLPFLAGRYHSLVVDKNSLPNSLLVDAETADGVIMGIKHKSLPYFGVQFHPESILTENGKALLKNFLQL